LLSINNDYFGRAKFGVTPFVQYSCLGMADAFAHVRTRAEEASRAGGRDQSPLLRERTAQQRQALGLFLRMKVATRNDEAIFFKLPSRQAYLLRARWLGEGFFEVANASTKGRSYRLANRFERLMRHEIG